jgi:hypothetical protein
MKAYRFPSVGILAFWSLVLLSLSSAIAQPVKERNEVLFEQIQQIHGLSDRQMDSVRAIFRESGYISQGNPAITEHPMTPDG